MSIAPVCHFTLLFYFVVNVVGSPFGVEMLEKRQCFHISAETDGTIR